MENLKNQDTPSLDSMAECREVYHKWITFDSPENITELQAIFKKH